jgi:Ca2+-binding EF-hand superfamily protein
MDTPKFYSAPAGGPRPAALVQGAAVAILVMGGVLALMGRGGGRLIPFSIGSRTPREGLLQVGTGEGPGTLSAEVVVKPPRERPSRGQLFNYFQAIRVLNAIDTDHDLIISDAEMAGAPAILRSLDLDHDGKLSPEECGFAAPENGPSADELFEEWMAFDRNRDGKLEAGELPERLRGVLQRAERDADGKVSAADLRRLAEREGAKRKGIVADPGFARRSRTWFMRVHPVLAALDGDESGDVSAVEISTAAAALRALDWNHDGELGAEELLPDPVVNAVAVYMVRWDLDGDGRITRQEGSAIPKPMSEVVASADRDGDGVITAGELRNEIRRRAMVDGDGGVRQLEIAGKTKDH